MFKKSMLYTLAILILTVLISIDCQFSDSDIVGETPYEYQVNNGDGVLSVPVPMPKGVSSLMPIKLSLDYSDSRTGLNRELGVGWSLSGTSSVDRCPKMPYYDNVYEKVTFSSSDVFCLDGQRLILVKGISRDFRFYFNKLALVSKKHRIVLILIFFKAKNIFD